MRTLIGIICLCAASWLCFVVGSWAIPFGDGVAYLVWFGLLTITGLRSGYVWPSSAVWGGVFVTLSQSAFLYERLWSIGEIQNPSSSTGGEIGWMIVTTMLVFFAPVPALASWFGKRLRARPALQGTGTDGTSGDSSGS